MRVLCALLLLGTLSLSCALSCTGATYDIYVQPPNWPDGMSTALSVRVDNPASLRGWAINFTAKGYGAGPSGAPFSITSFWNAGSISVVHNGDNTFTYTLTNAAWNPQSPEYIGFLANTKLAHPRNVICGLSINNVPCPLTVSPPVLPPPIAPSSILLSYTYHNSVSASLPLLVLVHGITEDRRSWDPLVPLLTPYYRILAVDLRGHGQSQVTVGAAGYGPQSLADDVYRTVRTVCGTKDLPLMVGHSLGGTVVTVYAHMYPVRGVLNVDQSMDLLSFQAGVLQIYPLLTSDVNTFNYVINQMFAGYYGQLNQSEVARLNNIRHPVQSVVLGVWAPLTNLTSTQLSALVDDLMRTPGGTSELTLFGQDPGATYSTWLSQRVPGAKVEVWGNGTLGHYPHLMFPYQFVQRVRDFDASAIQHLCL